MFQADGTNLMSGSQFSGPGQNDNKLKAHRVENRVLKSFLFLTASVALLAGGEAEARTRTAQFAGLAVNDPLTVEISNWSFLTTCSFVVANASFSNQIITKFEGMAYIQMAYSAGITPTQLFDSTNGLSLLYLTGFGSWRGDKDGTTCIGSGKVLAPGDACFIRYTVTTVPWGGRLAPCVGRITVEDETTPGSLIAAGTVYINQESMVLGGQLSGAYYASQTHIQSSDFSATATSSGRLESLPAFAGSYTFSGAQNMNVFCGAACYASSQAKSAGWSSTECNQHCGLGSAGDTNGWTNHINGWTMTAPNRDIHDDWATVYTRPSSSPDATPSPSPTVTVVGNATTSSTNGNVASMVQDGARDTTQVVSNAANAVKTAVEASDRLRLHSLANAHFAGGMVYEMEIGSYNAICSAHKQYYLDGGLEFSHADGVDSHAVYSANSTEYPGAPPERLVCAHRHMKPDLFMRTGSTSPIVVNGGMPF